MTVPAPSPDELARTAERLAGAGAAALARLSDREILDAWEATVAGFLDPSSPERRAIEEDLARSARLSAEGLAAGLESVLGGVRGASAERLFAEAAALRKAGPAERSGGAGGFALVVLASNLPALAVQPLLPALAARRPVLLKAPTAEPVFTAAFVHALAERLPALGEAVAAAVWPGGDVEREAPLLERASVVLAYGDEEAVASLERRTCAANPGARFVPYGPRTSLAVVGAAADPAEVAPGLARDVALFDQRGCLSVAAVYVEGDEARARAVAEALAAALRDLARRWPPFAADPATAGAVRQLRSLAAMRGLPVWEIGDSFADGTVLLDPDPAFRPSPGLRTVRVHPLADLGTLPELLAPWRDRLQGAAVAGLETNRPETLISGLGSLGISRVTPSGALQHPDTAWHNGGVNPLEVLLPGAMRSRPTPEP